VFLIFSKLSNDYKQTIKLNVKLTNIQDEIILQDDSLNTIDAYIEAKGFALIPFIFQNSKDLFVDVKSNVFQKSNHFIFNVQKHQFLIEEQLGESYKILLVKPDTLVMPYSKRASKMVPIVLNNSINYDAGYDIKGNFNLSVDSVKVVGSSSEIDKITSINTENLILKGVNTNVLANVKLDVLEYKHIEIFPKTITVTGRVTKFTEGTIEIPITIVNKPNNVVINYFPKSVTLSYYVDLENYNAINATDFKVECDFNEVKDQQTYFTPNVVRRSEFIKRASIKQKRIDFVKL
jgi:hypothetical protein